MSDGCAFGNHQLLGDLAIRATLHNQVDDLAFAVRERSADWQRTAHALERDDSDGLDEAGDRLLAQVGGVSGTWSACGYPAN